MCGSALGTCAEIIFRKRESQMKKVIALLLAAMMMVAVFASCTGGDTNTSSGNAGTDSTVSDANTGTDTGFNVDAAVMDGEQGASLKVWGPSAYVKLLKKQCDAFVKLYPDQNITIKVVAQGESDAGTQIMQDPQAGADVFGLPSDQLADLVKSGTLAKVNAKFAENVKATDLEAAYNASTIDGTLYAYPETGNGYYLVYDKSVVSDDDAKTLEGILAACKKAGKKFIMDAGNGFYACMFMFTGGLKYDGLDKNGTQQFNDYDEDEVVATLKAFSKLMHEYAGTFTSLDVGNIPSGFASTKSRASTCGAGIDGTWDSAADKEALGKNFGAAKLPTINVDGEDKQIVSMYGYKMIGVNGSSKYPKTSQVLAYYLSSEECQKQRCEELGWDPTNNAVIESDVVKNDAAISALVEQSQHAVAQVNLASTVWNPVANLGNKLNAEETNPEKFDFKALLKSTIANIKDE